MLAMFSRFFFSMAVVVGASNAVDDWGWTHFPGITLDAKCQISSIEGWGGMIFCCLGWGVGLLLFFKAALFGLLIYDLTPGSVVDPPWNGTLERLVLFREVALKKNRWFVDQSQHFSRYLGGS